jgi:hypothetical protein
MKTDKRTAVARFKEIIKKTGYKYKNKELNELIELFEIELAINAEFISNIRKIDW